MTAPSRRPLDVASIPLSGVHLIEASAGTGKTYTITSLVLRLIVEREIEIERILAVTFTNAATGELRERVERRIVSALDAVRSGATAHEDVVLDRLLALPDRARVESLLRRALTNVDRASVFTIHGFAQRVLRDHAFETGARFEVELLGDSSRLAYDAVVDFWSARIARLEPFEYRSLGGASFFQDLERVAQEASSSVDVDVAPHAPSPDLEAYFAALDGPFSRARERFVAHLDEALAILRSKQVHQGRVRPESVARDVVLWTRYFANGDPRARPPASFQRWSQAALLERATKGSRPEHPLFVAFEELEKAWLPISEGLELLKIELRAELVEFVRTRVREFHESGRTQSFDDLLLDLRDALADPERGPLVREAARKKFPIALIDEFQDTDPVQYEIFRRLFGEGAVPAPGNVESTGLFLIGDPKQSIYSFRGADVFSYLRAGHDATSGIWTLSTSYRADPSLVRAQNALWSVPSPFLVGGIDYEPIAAAPGRADRLVDRDGAVVSGIRIAEGPEAAKKDFARTTAREVTRLLHRRLRLVGEHGARELTPGNVAVLTRTNSQAEQVQAELRRLGVPAVMHGDRSVFEAQEAKELRRILLALLEPGQKRLVRAALGSRYLGLDAARIFELESDVSTLELWTERFRRWASSFRKEGVVYALESLIEETGLVERTLADLDGERRMTNLRHLIEILHEAEVNEHWGPTGLVRFLEAGIADPLGHAMAIEARQLRLESDADAVTLTTLHKSKGLEYDVVFLPSLGFPNSFWKKPAYRFRSPDEGTTLLELREGDERRRSSEIAFFDQCAEDLRLAYVGLTRARHHTVITTSSFAKEGRRTRSDKSESFAPLAFLLHGDHAPKPGDGFWFHVETLSEQLREADFARLLARSGTSIERGTLTDEAPPPFVRSRSEVTLHARTGWPEPRDGSKTGSFSSLTRPAFGEARSSRASREGRDRDEHVVTQGGDGAPASSEIRLDAFPRGALPGEALHAIFEHAPFLEGTPEARRVIVERELSARGIELAHVDRVARAVEDVLATEITPGLTLGKLGARSRRAELEFSLPVGTAEARLSARRLALGLGLVDRHEFDPIPSGAPTSTLSQRYLARVAGLAFPAWSGFLRGFVDLVCEVDGRLHVVDYKSNHLGSTYDDYERSKLEAAMEEHHYPLQALFYALAIHRHAAIRVPGYSYERSFGGVHYLFVRGMDPAHGARRGVYTLRPSLEEMERFSRLFTDPRSVHDDESVMAEPDIDYEFTGYEELEEAP